jgi:hypothetical protein
MESNSTEEFRKEDKYGKFHQSDISDGLCKPPKNGMMDCTAELSLHVSSLFIHPVLFHSHMTNACKVEYSIRKAV